MRRPLFWACLFLVITAAIRFLLTGGFAPGGGAEGPPEWGQEVVLAGKVCGRETGNQKNVFILEIDILKSNQFAAASQQITNYLENIEATKLRCEMAGAGGAMPEIGSRVSVRGKFSAYEGASNPGEFDFAEYYRANGVGGRLRDTVILEKSAGYSRLGEGLFRLREFLGKRLDRAFPEKEAGVMKTMLLGDRSGLDPELKELYQEGGIIHILSISGLHITLLGMGVYRLLRKLGAPNGASALTGGLFLLFYGVMTGMSVSACRAIGMFLLRMLSLSLGRTYDMLTALGVMGAGMLCLCPAYLLHSGFWLSFGSLFGAGCVLPVLEELAAGAPAESESRGLLSLIQKAEKGLQLQSGGRRKGRAKLLRKVGLAFLQKIGGFIGGLAGGLRGGAAILLATLPLQLRFYFEVPVFSMAVNLLVLPCMGAVVGCGFLAMLLPGFTVFGAVDVLALRGFEGLCALTGGLPFHTWNPGCPALWQMGLYYLCLAGALLLLQDRKRRAEITERGIPAGYRLAGTKSTAVFVVGRHTANRRLPLKDKLSGHRGVMKRLSGTTMGCGDISEEISGKAPTGRENQGWLRGEGQESSGFQGGLRGESPGCSRTQGGLREEKPEFCEIRWWEKCAAFAVKWLVVFLPVALFALPVHRTAGILFLDVGQGDGICLRAESGETWLYDCGSSSKKLVGENILIPYLKHEGIRRISGVILSHGDKDHVSGLLELFALSEKEGIRIDRVILPALAENGEEAFSEILDYESERLFDVIRVKAGDRFGGKALSFAVLNPEGGERESDNASSLCLLARFRERKTSADILLTGDVEGPGEEVLLAELEKLGTGNVDVLKCAHHGSKNATSQAFLEAVDARIAVISCGKDNSYGHPHPELLERLEGDGAALFRTDLSGAVSIEFLNNGCRVRTFRGN